MIKIKQLLPYFIAIASFIIVALAYFSPVLDGKKILQSDIVQYQGMSKEIKDFRKAHDNTEPYWTDAAFGGMPAYQVSAYYPHNYIKKLDKLILFLPRPADYLFLYFFGFFVFMMVLKVDWRLAIIGSIAFGFSTYLIIILGVGHNAKAHAIGYMPLVLAGVLLLFQKKYFVGFLLTTVAAALEIAAGHVQMTYYLFLMLLIVGLVYFYTAFKEKQMSPFFKSVAVLLIAGVLSLLMNANHLLPTRQYAKESTRSKSELTRTPDGKKKKATSGLDKDYITEYSYGILETFNLFIPRLMGGGNSENLGTDSNTYRFLRDKIGVSQAKGFAENAPTYWGKQPIVAAPAYIGAVLIFLFVLSLFLLNTKNKKWLVGSILLALMLSWGKNFSFLTNFFIDYIPLYNKFRAVTSIQVLIELAIPILGVLGLQKMIFDSSIPLIKKEKALKYATFITGGIALFFLIFGSSWFAFEGGNDAYYNSMIPNFSEALIQDRKSLLFQDSLRSLLLVLAVSSLLWLFSKKKLKLNLVIGVLGALLLYDGIGITKNYVNASHFKAASSVDKPFKASNADKAILQDKGHYRVANFSKNPMNDGSTSYFHNSIGGYHAAKPRRYQELFDYQIAKNNMAVLNMLNTKYMILADEKGQTQVQLNDKAYGNAWFVNTVEFVKSADEELKVLDSLTKNKAIIRDSYKDLLTNLSTEIDSTASIQLETYQANQIEYTSHLQSKKIAVFSEIYYPYGWKAFIDMTEAKIIPVNYVLRGLVVPEGTHTIVFKFEPEVVKKGGLYSLVGYLIFVILTIAFYFLRKKFKS